MAEESADQQGGEYPKSVRRLRRFHLLWLIVLIAAVINAVVVIPDLITALRTGKGWRLWLVALILAVLLVTVAQPLVRHLTAWIVGRWLNAKESTALPGPATDAEASRLITVTLVVMVVVTLVVIALLAVPVVLLVGFATG
ncbi:hypothetical protein ACFVUS_12230 [Nocardia sp. NPDC058058]|uniref:hypothetical protein n=1 Tax=Nocardia sp. NPDC058058 TaxID=3346317 RepID=UPI0036DE3F0C